MNSIDIIDLSLILHPNGWSSCRIIMDTSHTDIIISHVFSDPYYDLIYAIEKVINKESEFSFYWYGEPGGEKLKFTRIKNDTNIIKIEILGFTESYGEEIKNYNQTLTFFIKEHQFVILFYLQLKKIFLLLKDNEYAKNRQNDFPFQEFKKLDSIVQKYLQEI